MDALTVVTDIIVILGVTVPVIIWAWRKVDKAIADQKREREQTIVAVAAIAKRLDMIEHSFIYQRDRSVQKLADELVTAKEQNEQLVVTQTTLSELQDDVLKLQAAQVRAETDQQEEFNQLRVALTQLQTRFEKIASGYFPRP